MNSERAIPSDTRVLIVEDDATARETLADYLTDCGYAVEAAASASEALGIAERFQPELLLSDWDLGGSRTGIDVARELQAEQGVKVIFISGNPLHQLRNATRDLDVVRYLRKPVSLNRLTRLIRESREALVNDGHWVS